MKILDNSAQYSNFTIDQLEQERSSLKKAQELARKLGTGTGGVDELLAKVEEELQARNSSEHPVDQD